MGKKKRPLSLTAGILNIVGGALTIISSIYMLYILSSYEFGGVYAGAYLISAIFGAAILTFAIILLCKIRKVNYPKGIAITLFVFDIICGLLYVYSLVSGSSEPIVTLLMMVMYILAAIFLIIDVVKKHPENVVAPQMQGQVVNPVNVAPNTNKVVNVEENEFMAKMQQLQKMKESGILSEADYEKLKDKLIEKY